ncbi:MAG TPA: SDR family oxidoreductase [Gemmatimonadales bacterium]|nr:SDR family oxidoreductase [Gemmatimonadales bacterium]
MSAPPLFGRTAVVTGASRGIGLAIAEELQAAGAHVVRLARSLADGEAERRSDLRCDVTDAASVARAAGRVLESRGAPDVLVNAAGVFLVAPVAETTPQDFGAQLAGNLVAPFLVLRAFLPAMTARGRGLVVTIGSVADHHAFTGNAAYGAAKSGLRGLHEVLRAELRGSGVRATLISPGPTDTAIWDPVDPDRRPGFTKRAQMLKPEDVAEAVLFVATRRDEVAIPELRIMPETWKPRT